jgi:hypothetical protein
MTYNKQDELKTALLRGYDKSHLLAEGTVLCIDCSKCTVISDGGVRHEDSCTNNRQYKMRPYYCPACGNNEDHGTNHIREIYCNCKNCGNSLLYCAFASFENEPFEEAKMFAYRYSIDKPEDARNYALLCAKLRNKGYKLFDTIAINSLTMKAMCEHAGEVIQLYKVDQFDNQFVSNIGRVHYWAEAIYPNRNVKEGYWIERNN